MPPNGDAKRPATLLAGPYGHPVHPILVTVPIGAWVASFVFDLASHTAVADAAMFARGSYWLIALGLVGAAAAALVGALDLFVIPTGTRAFRIALLHMALNLGVAVAYLVNLLIRGGGPGAGGVPIGLIVLSGASLTGLAVAGWLGGMLAFRYGVRVVGEETQADGFAVSGHPPPTNIPGSPRGD